jgi:hypothetical protein
MISVVEVIRGGSYCLPSAQSASQCECSFGQLVLLESINVGGHRKGS